MFYEVWHLDHLCRPFRFSLLSAMKDVEEMRGVGPRVKEAVEGVMSSSSCVVALW